MLHLYIKKKKNGQFELLPISLYKNTKVKKNYNILEKCIMIFIIFVHHFERGPATLAFFITHGFLVDTVHLIQSWSGAFHTHKVLLSQRCVTLVWLFSAVYCLTLPLTDSLQTPQFRWNSSVGAPCKLKLFLATASACSEI